MDEPFDKYLEGLGESRAEELGAAKLLWKLYVQAGHSLIDALDRDIHDASASLLLQCVYRLREHLLSLLLVHVRAFPSSAEALSRVVVETSVNVAYLCVGERLERFNEYFADYIERERTENRKWQKESDSISAAGKEIQNRQIRRKNKALDTYEDLLSEVYGQMGRSYNKGKRWPNAFERFRALGKQLGYRTVYAALSSQVHNDAEDLLNVFLVRSMDPTGRGKEAVEDERWSFGRGMVLVALSEAGFAFAFTTATFGSREQTEMARERWGELQRVPDAFADAAMGQ